MIKFPKDQINKLVGQKLYCARVFFKETENEDAVPYKMEMISDIIKDIQHNRDDEWHALTIKFNNLKDLNLKFVETDFVDENYYALDCHEIVVFPDECDNFEFHFLTEEKCKEFIKKLKKDIRNEEIYEDSTEVYYYSDNEVFDGSQEYFMPPENCPVCEEKLIMNGEYLCCVNPDCPAQLAGSIRNWINKLNILEFGDAIINAVIESGMVKDIGDLYDLDPYKVSLLQNEGRYLGKNGEKAVNNLKEKKEITVENFIGSLGIPLWGRSMIRLLIGAGYNNLEKIYSLTISDLSKIKGIGDTKAEALIKGLEEKRNLIDKIISKGVKFKVRDGNLNGKSFCFTGFRSAELQEKIENAGGVIKSGVSKDLTYLVVLDINSTSGKTEKAKSYGVNIIGLNEAKEMVG